MVLSAQLSLINSNLLRANIVDSMAHETPAQQSSWNQAKAKSKEWFEKVGVPVNKATNKLGAEAFWPTSLDKESDKAARILRSFCMDGFRAEKDGKGIDHIPVEVSLDTPVRSIIAQSANA